MKIVLTESQVERLVSEQIMVGSLFNKTPIQKAAVSTVAGAINMDPHTRNTILQIGASFVPFVGPALSMGIGAYDASLYRKEGKNKEAGLTLFLSTLPGLSAVINEVPGLKQLGMKGIISLVDKVSMASEITPTEKEILNKIGMNPKIVSAAKEYLKNKLISSGYDISSGLVSKK